MRVLGHQLALHGHAKVVQLLVAANDLQVVAGEDDGIAGRNVDASLAAQDAADVYAKAVSEAQGTQCLARPARVFGYLEVGDVDVTAQEMPS